MMRRQVAWILILIVEVGYIAWGAGAAASLVGAARRRHDRPASAITYDRMVNAIGRFEVTEYIGLVMVWGALAVTAPFGAAARPVSATG